MFEEVEWMPTGIGMVGPHAECMPLPFSDSGGGLDRGGEERARSTPAGKAPPQHRSSSSTAAAASRDLPRLLEGGGGSPRAGRILPTTHCWQYFRTAVQNFRHFSEPANIFFENLFLISTFIFFGLLEFVT